MDTRDGRTLARVLGAAALAATAALAGCRSTTSIGDLMDDPFRYDGQTVEVEGEVTESLGFLGPGIYRLRDATGIVPVVSEEGGAPRSGSRVRVRGVFQAALTLGDRSLAVLVERERRSP